ncbi:MAG TPA: phosphodiester glycosidase family protein [Candidatus Sulfomarinibacteraceae bacterium]|nr:phosphodiester glycosidase family protein [Candidatus Sulfomarinibacteraceae bacterium]
MLTTTHHRCLNDDSTFSDTLTFRFPPGALRFTDLTPGNLRRRLRDISHYRYVQAQARGEPSPTIVAFGTLAEDRPLADLFPDLPSTTDDDERLFSANSFITYTMRTLFRRGWIRYERGDWQPAVPPARAQWQERAAAVLRYLTGRRRILLRSERPRPLDFSDVPFAVDQDLVPLAPCGFLSDFVRTRRGHRRAPALVFNSAYFLLEHDDVCSRHSALGEAHSLWAAGGVIHRPPLFHRGAIWQHSDGRWRVGRLGLNDMQIRLPTGLELVPDDRPATPDQLPFALNDANAAPVTLYNRYYGVAQQGRVVGHTPSDPQRLELTVVDRRIVGLKQGGGLALPHNGFVISIAPGALSPDAQHNLRRRLQSDLLLAYAFARPEHREIVQALQTGPILLRDGQITLDDDYLEAEEQFWPSRALANGDYQIGVVPTNYKTDVDRTRAGRVGLGIDEQGDLILVMVAGVNDGMGLPGVDSFGATLRELAEALRAAGAHSALNLDGGGSTQAYHHGRRALIPGDRRGEPGQPYERMVPAMGIVE